jgi:integrase
LIVQPQRIAERLDVPEPEPQNWHPDIGQLARFLDAIPYEEESRLLRFTILTLIFGRPEAVRELRPFQINVREQEVQLNAPGRRQTKKYRPTLPMPDVVWPSLLSWRDAATIVHKNGKPVISFGKKWREVRELAGLPTEFTAKSLRHMLATELRARKVPKEEREMWQGHRRLSTNDRYG